MTQPAQAGQVPIVQPPPMECGGQIVAVELRIVPRPRHRANIDDPANVVRAQETHKLFDRTRRMSDGVDDGAHAFSVSRHGTVTLLRHSRGERDS